MFEYMDGEKIQSKNNKKFVGIPQAPLSYDNANYATSKLFELQGLLDKMTPQERDIIADHPERIFAEYNVFKNDEEFRIHDQEFQSRLAAWRLDKGLTRALNQFKAIETKIPKNDPKRVELILQGIKFLETMREEWAIMEKKQLPDRIKGDIQGLKDTVKKIIIEKKSAIEENELQMTLQNIIELSDDRLFDGRLRAFIANVSKKLSASRKLAQIDKLKMYNKLLVKAQNAEMERGVRNKK